MALLADMHHGPFVPLAYIRHVISMTNSLQPDIITLVGDFVHRHARYISPGIEELGKLHRRLGALPFGATTITETTMVLIVSGRSHVPQWQMQSYPI